MTKATDSVDFQPLEDAELEEFMQVFMQHVASEVFAAQSGRATPFWRAHGQALLFQNFLGDHYSPLPKAVTDAADYRDFLEAISEHGTEAIVEFRDLRSQNREF